ncbi:MAG: hypothetical protein LBL62_03780 [Planctomycetaceae bacterium]|jgi:hypothetical protein|nr:hypothetical protein [Planctomycetaceae bacterium]
MRNIKKEQEFYDYPFVIAGSHPGHHFLGYYHLLFDKLEKTQAVVPNILDFALYCLTSGEHRKRFVNVPFLSALKSRIAVWFIEKQRDKVRKVLRQHKRFPNLPLDKTAFVSHHKEYNDSESLCSNRVIMLADFLERAIVIPHYFGKVNITPKNNITKFFVIGTVQPNLRNFSLLFSAVEQLAKQRTEFMTGR